MRTAGEGNAEQRERRCQVVQLLHVSTSSAQIHAMASVAWNSVAVNLALFERLGYARTLPAASPYVMHCLQEARAQNLFSSCRQCIKKEQCGSTLTQSQPGAHTTLFPAVLATASLQLTCFGEQQAGQTGAGEEMQTLCSFSAHGLWTSM